MALDALAYRNRENETYANAPARIRPRLEAANPKRLYVEGEGHEWLRTRISHDWYRQNATANIESLTAADIQKLSADDIAILINQVRSPSDQAFSEIMKRPWLDLRHTDLTGVELDSPFFEGGELSDVNLSRSKLHFASLARAGLARSRILGSLFGSDLRGANLECADVRKTDLGRADLRDAWMSGGNFSKSNFWKTNLEGAYLLLADMTEVQSMSGARLDNVIAFGADFTDAWIEGDLSENVCMQRAFLRRAEMKGAHLRGVDLRYSDLRDADLRQAKLRGADLRGTILDGAQIEGVDLSIADLRDANLTNAIGKPLRMTGAKVNGQTKLPKDLQDQFNDQLSWVHEWPFISMPCTLGNRSDDERKVLTTEEQTPDKQ